MESILLERRPFTSLTKTLLQCKPIETAHKPEHIKRRAQLIWQQAKSTFPHNNDCIRLRSDFLKALPALIRVSVIFLLSFEFRSVYDLTWIHLWEPRIIADQVGDINTLFELDSKSDAAVQWSPLGNLPFTISSGLYQTHEHSNFVPY